jgi:hypothetical protein
MEGHAESAGIAYAAVAAAEAGFYFDGISQHVKSPSLFMVNRHWI